jgi:hypothetical protein
MGVFCVDTLLANARTLLPLGARVNETERKHFNGAYKHLLCLAVLGSKGPAFLIWGRLLGLDQV